MLLLLCAMLLALPLLILWLSVPTEWPPSFGRNLLPEHRAKAKTESQIETPVIGVENDEVLVEPTTLVQWLAAENGGQKLRIFEVREGGRSSESETNLLAAVPRTRQL